ncbi:flavodoxin family protein [Maricaulis sp.]|uniref:flavodoxin family protein n=1 Tax=Maricaulis sp. TaxID=1486257 RepID=UPI002B268DF4|nr:flavodoxin family protein [Maricaulis sp.]
MADYSDLKAVFVNCTLKRSPETSNTEGLMGVSRAIMDRQGVSTELVRLVDHDIAFGVYPDMTKHGWPSDEWPSVWQRIEAADILVIGTPIWLGEESSVARILIERLYAQSGDLNGSGQYATYGKVGGCLVTGNEDGIKHVAMSVLYALQHVGYTIPPQADAGWIGEAGPGPSYLDENSGGPQNDFTQRNTTFMSWNLMHMAAMLKRAGGLPSEGNSRTAWDDGARFDHPNPEYR